MLKWLRRALTKRRITPATENRRERMEEVEPSDRFVLSVALMIIFFTGLVALEVVYMLVFDEWNEVVFNGVMLIVGSIVGSLFGYSEG